MRKLKMPKQQLNNFEDVFHTFEASQNAKGVSETTLNNYKYNLKYISKYLDVKKPFEDVTKRDIEQMVAGMREAGLAHNTIATYVMLIPIYNIYFVIKLFIDWAHAFHKSTGFAIGMVFLPFIFQLILAFDANAQYRDGTAANTTPDILTKVADKTKEFTGSVSKPNRSSEDNALEKLEKLSELKERGILSEEEFNEKKAELLTKI